MMAEAADTPGDLRGLGQRRFDTLTDLAHDILTTGTWTGTGSRPRTDTGCGSGSGSGPGRAGPGGPAGRPRKSAFLINVTIPAGALAGIDDHPGWINGFGPIDAATARRLAADATWRRIVTDPLSGNVLDVGRTRYPPPPYLADHVKTRDRTCVTPGCDQDADRCHLDHRDPYRPGRPTGGATSADNLNPLCEHHHRAKDGGGCHLAKTSDGSYEWTTALGRTYSQPQENLYEDGDHLSVFNSHQTDPTIPAWAKSRINGEPTTPAPTAHQANDDPIPF